MKVSPTIGRPARDLSIMRLLTGTLVITVLAGCSRPAVSTGEVERPSSRQPVVAAPPNSPLADSPASTPVGAAEPPTVRSLPADLDQVLQQIELRSGEVVVLDIWSTSCMPCLEELPKLQALSHRDGVFCLSLNVDYVGLPRRPPESYREQAQRFLESLPAGKTVHLLSTTADEEVFEHFGIESIPAVLVYDADGRLRQRLTDASTGGQGLTYEDHVLPVVAALLPSQ